MEFKEYKNELKIRGYSKETIKSYLYFNKRLLDFTKKTTTEINNKDINKYLLDMIEKYGAKDWYDWHINNWGTKWDLTAELLCSDEGYLQYCFDSAWSPPIEFLKEVSKKYTRLEFRLRYDEPGVGFMGVAKYKNGEGEDKCLDY